MLLLRRRSLRLRLLPATPSLLRLLLRLCLGLSLGLLLLRRLRRRLRLLPTTPSLLRLLLRLRLSLLLRLRLRLWLLLIVYQMTRYD
jgi:hypothetical protein